MFLCDDCHDAKKHFDIFRSFGTCEGCGKSAICIDCHFDRCYIRRTRKKKKGEGKKKAKS